MSDGQPPHSQGFDQSPHANLETVTGDRDARPVTQHQQQAPALTRQQDRPGLSEVTRRSQQRHQPTHPPQQIAPPGVNLLDLRPGDIPAPEPCPDDQPIGVDDDEKGLGPPADEGKGQEQHRHRPDQPGHRVQQAIAGQAVSGPDRQHEKQAAERETKPIRDHHGTRSGTAQGTDRNGRTRQDCVGEDRRDDKRHTLRCPNACAYQQATDETGQDQKPEPNEIQTLRCHRHAPSSASA
jgi:hypothetical protein